jgi:hypothetical protein
VKVTERFKLSADGTTLLSTQEFEDPQMLDNRGVRFIAWRREVGQHVFPYECDPGFAGNYAKPAGGAKPERGGKPEAGAKPRAGSKPAAGGASKH